ncbi:hypothetical protein HHK36_021147 [Tetracentron sinense]|uniref:Uncharacterized protein n=1 Tax=Tetracentron sinense TaxID=13715 RepID=A0A834YQZ4_TETSI|nr:hypothetical protein HHK36_021147 [Tetracentron sinense]
MGIDLQRAVKKVRFLLSLNIYKWRVAASIVGASSRRRLSFNHRPGLRGCSDDTDCYETSYSPGIQRTKSFATDEDIDKRADMFIANFYRRLQIERQVQKLFLHLLVEIRIISPRICAIRIKYQHML